jgi:sulfite reductase alpha subunit-like flavoprotein
MEITKQKEDELLILYGSQTNTAKYASEELGREALRRGLQTKI